MLSLCLAHKYGKYYISDIRANVSDAELRLKFRQAGRTQQQPVCITVTCRGVGLLFTAAEIQLFDMLLPWNVFICTCVFTVSVYSPLCVLSSL